MNRRYSLPLFNVGGCLLYTGLAVLQTSQSDALPLQCATLLFALLTGVFVFENARLRAPLPRAGWGGGVAVFFWFMNPWTMRPTAYQEMDALWFALLAGLWIWLWVETYSWSTFMRGGLLTLAAVFLLKQHTGGALLFFAAMLLWSRWNRRPNYSLAVCAGVIGFSSVMYWSACLAYARFSGTYEPWWGPWGHARGFYSAWQDQMSLWVHPDFINDRWGYLIKTVFAFSPFFFILGLESLMLSIKEMTQTRRANGLHYGAIAALLLLMIQLGDSLVWNAVWSIWIPVTLQPWLQQNQWWGVHATQREHLRTGLVASSALYFLAARGWLIIR